MMLLDATETSALFVPPEIILPMPKTSKLPFVTRLTVAEILETNMIQQKTHILYRIITTLSLLKFNILSLFIIHSHYPQ